MEQKSVLVTGGAGYVGAVLVPKLVREGYHVKVLDLMLYGDDVFEKADCDTSHIEVIKGDIRDQDLLRKHFNGVWSVIHLACISNDPSFELNPNLGKSINLDAFEPMVQIAKENGVERFIYASSSSVYGIKEESNVTEDMTLEPLTDYSKFKAQCEEILKKYFSEDFITCTIRPATVCGYSPRQRLDVIVNILTNHAFHNRSIKVFGGPQLRPNLHIQDMTDLYVRLLELPGEKINGKIFNAGYENHSVTDLASMVQKVIGNDVKIETVPTDDNRSYHISSSYIEKEIGFKPKHTVEEAASDLKKAFEKDLLPDPMNNKRYFNIKTMLEADLN